MFPMKQDNANLNTDIFSKEGIYEDGDLSHVATKPQTYED